MECSSTPCFPASCTQQPAPPHTHPAHHTPTLHSLTPAQILCQHAHPQHHSRPDVPGVILGRPHLSVASLSLSSCLRHRPRQVRAHLTFGSSFPFCLFILMEFVTVFPYQICGYNPEVGRHRSSLYGNVVIQVIITPTTSCYYYCN